MDTKLTKYKSSNTKKQQKMNWDKL